MSIDERTALYDSYNATQTAQPAEEKVEEVKPDTSTGKIEETAKEAGKKEGTDGEKELEVSVETKKKGDLETALREERAKRRQIKVDYESKLAEKESQLNELLQTMKSYITPTKEEEVVVGDYEEEIKRLKMEIQDIKTWKTSTDETTKNLEKEKNYKELMGRVEKVGKELDDEGHPGFPRFISLVTDELSKLPDNLRKEMDNEEGWKEIYKNTVFPSIKSIFQSVTKDEKFKVKDEKKTKAQMLGESKGEAITETKKEWTWDDYMAWRIKQSSG